MRIHCTHDVDADDMPLNLGIALGETGTVLVSAHVLKGCPGARRATWERSIQGKPGALKAQELPAGLLPLRTSSRRKQE